jgi:hypothetical protein
MRTAAVLLVGLCVLSAAVSQDLLEDAAGLFEDSAEEATPESGARTDPVLSGYVEASARSLDPYSAAEVQAATKTKLRFRGESGSVRARAEIDATAYAGSHTTFLVDYLPEELRTPWLPYRDQLVMTYEESVEVAQAYATIPVGTISVALGRQPLALGTGYAWNPVDLFSAKNSLEPTYQVPAHDALLLSAPIPLNGLARLAVIAAPETAEATDLSGFVSARINLLFDWEVSLSSQRRIATDFSTFGTSPLRRMGYGLATAGQVGNFGVHGEIAAISEEDEGLYWSWLAGADTTLEIQNRLLVEFLYDGSGSSGDYSAADWLRYLTGEKRALATRYLFASTTQTVLDVVEISLSGILNTTDWSTTVFPEIFVNFSERADLRAVLYWSRGRSGSEFASLPDVLELRITAYF